MDATPYVSAILLAAGLSSRMGDKHKLLLRLGGKSVVRLTAENVVRSAAAETIVVVGANQTAIVQELTGLDLKLVYNPLFEQGMSTSLQAGLTRVAPEAEAVLVILADQPNLTAQTINLFAQAFQASGKSIVAGHYGPVTGNPALFSRKYFAELQALRGDIGAKSIVHRHADRVHLIDLPEEATLDIDRPEDYERARAILKTKCAR